jgi:enoyl-CoA hydratase
VESPLGTSHLSLEREGPIAWCTINRPKARNALTPAMYFGIKRAVQLANSDPELAALIITGVDDVFTSGGDLRNEPDETVPPVVDEELLPFLTMRNSAAPVIAAVNGLCHAGGVLIAMMADIAVASKDASFRLPELLRGILDATSAAVLPAHVGLGMARDLLFSAREFDADEAKQLGIVSRIVPPEDVREAALEAARQILRTAPDARTHMKRMLNERYGPFDYQMQFLLQKTSGEMREGARAFFEKRAPSWAPVV